jgi:hypothetical protein
MTARALVVLTLAWLPSAALAGTVSFIPRTPTTVEQGEVVIFDVVISESAFGRFDGASMVVASDSVFVFDFWLDGCFSWPCRSAAGVVAGLPPPAPFPIGLFPSDLFFGDSIWHTFGLPFIEAPKRMGQLLVQTSATPAGEHEIFVSSAREIKLLSDWYLSSLFAGSATEPLEGRATITVVPEPATLVLLLPALGAVHLRIRARKEPSS